VAAKDYWDGGPVRRYVSSLFNVILIDRKKVKARNNPIDMMIEEIGNRDSLIVFPEGSRNPTGEMRKFKSGMYYLAKKRPDLEFMPKVSFSRCHCSAASRSAPRSGSRPANANTIFWAEPVKPLLSSRNRTRTNPNVDSAEFRLFHPELAPLAPDLV
jgi:hypothetical protein